MNQKKSKVFFIYSKFLYFRKKEEEKKKRKKEKLVPANKLSK